MKQYIYTIQGQYIVVPNMFEKFSQETFSSNSCDCYEVVECKKTVVNNKKDEKCRNYTINP